MLSHHGTQADAWARAFHEAQPTPALSLAVARSDGLVWSAAFGHANLELAIPASPEHLFRLGSVSKAVTATTAARLVSRGLLEFDVPIAYWLPDLPSHHCATTMRQLLTHRGGVRHYLPKDLDRNAPGGGIMQRIYTSREDILVLFIDDPLIAPPGTEVIPQRASGYHTAREIEMAAAAMQVPVPDLPGGFANVTRSNPAFCWAGAGLLMSMPDLARFGAAHLEGPQARVTAKERELLFTPLTEATAKSPPLGLGWRIDRDAKGRLRWHHAGATPGGRAVLVIYPELDLSIALASNVMSTPGDVLGPAAELADVFA